MMQVRQLDLAHALDEIDRRDRSSPAASCRKHSALRSKEDALDAKARQHPGMACDHTTSFLVSD